MITPSPIKSFLELFSVKTFVVIPAYNEYETVGRAIEEAKKFADEVIVVDDGSTDATSARGQKSGAVMLRHLLNLGQGAALRTGIRAALDRGAGIIVTFDADLQQDATEIPDLVAPVAAGLTEVVLGSRFLGAAVRMPVSRRLLLKLAIIFTRATTGLKLTDTHNGFRAFSRRAAENICLSQNGFAHASEIIAEIARLKLRFVEVPVNIRYSPYSLGKGQSARGAAKIIFDLLKGDIFR